MDEKFKFIQTKIYGPVIIEPRILKDKRGFFTETYNHRDFKKNGIADKFIQDNYSSSKKNVLRGLHYQRKPFATSKLVQCIEGEIFDVVVDIRPRSKTFGKWISVTLSEKNKRMLYVPPEFAHGFYVIGDKARVNYKVTEYYYPEYDAGIRWNDASLSIPWPCSKPIVSEKDSGLPPLSAISQK